VGSKLRLTWPDAVLPSAWAILIDRLFRGGRRTAGVPHVFDLLVAATTLASDAALADIEAQADVFFEPPLSEFPLLDFGIGPRLAQSGFDHASIRLAERKSAASADQEGLWALVAQLEKPAAEAASIALAKWAQRKNVPDGARLPGRTGAVDPGPSRSR